MAEFLCPKLTSIIVCLQSLNTFLKKKKKKEQLYFVVQSLKHLESQSITLYTQLLRVYAYIYLFAAAQKKLDRVQLILKARIECPRASISSWSRVLFSIASVWRAQHLVLYAERPPQQSNSFHSPRTFNISRIYTLPLGCQWPLPRYQSQ